MIEYLGFSPQILFLIAGDIVLLLISGMMSSSEVAYFSLTPAELRRLRRGGSVSAEAAAKLLDNPDMLLATILVVNNAVNIGTVVLTTQILSLLFNFGSPVLSFVVYTVVVTFILLLFGEVLPKVVAQGTAMRVALMFAQPLTVFRWVASPLSRVLVRTSTVVSDRLSQKNNDLSIEDLADAVDMTKTASTEEQRILSGIVNFASREVEQIMRPRMDIVAVEQTMTFGEIKQIITSSGYSRLPVYSDSIDNIKGTLFIKDLIAHAGKGDDFGWQSLIREPYIVPMHKQITDLLEDFRHDKVHMAIVVDEYGATQGLLTLEDILEEVVGEISDESDIDESFYERIDEHTYIFEGKTHIVDMLRVLNLEDSLFADVQGRAETIAGLMLEIKRNFLKQGEQITSHSIRFVVTSVEGHRIDQIKVITPTNG